MMPDGSLQPEWTDTKAYTTLSSELMQTEIFRHFSATPSSWLLFLGFCDPRVSLSPSLSFFRRFSGRFIRKLTRTPDLESLRERAAIDISPAVLSGSLEGVPMMSGAEYINRDLLLGVWANLSSVFSSLIQNHVGSVKSFVRSFSPDIHLVGRVFFHLVENKHGRLPLRMMILYLRSHHVT